MLVSIFAWRPPEPLRSFVASSRVKLPANGSPPGTGVAVVPTGVVVATGCADGLGGAVGKLPVAGTSGLTGSGGASRGQPARKTDRIVGARTATWRMPAFLLRNGRQD